MAVNRVHLPLIVATSVVAAAVTLSSSGLLSIAASTVADDVAQSAVGLTAAVACGWSGLRQSGLERRWRLLMAVAMAGWVTGQVVCSWHQIVGKEALPGPSWADVGSFMFPVFAFVALLALARAGAVGTDTASGRRSRWLLVLDGLVVVGSLFIVTWSTALGAVVRARPPNVLEFLVAIGYPVTDLILVVMVTLLIATYQGARPRRPQLVLLGLGLVAISVSDSLFAYVIASGAGRMPPILNAGFVAGPALIAVAALVHVGGRHRDPDGSARAGEWGYRLVPYLPVLAAGVVMLSTTLAEGVLEPISIYVGMLVVALVVIRQTIALVDNSILLRQVVEAQERLSYLAFHDPLTGLANRALFRERLTAAVERAQRSRRTIAVIFVDLDDFKMVNDSLGHSEGDLVLREVGERLHSCVERGAVEQRGAAERGAVERGATVARLGGDEFGVLLEADIEQAREVGTRILAALRRPVTTEGRPMTVGASLGVVLADGTDPSLSADALIRRADAAMYASKRRSKGGMVVYEPGIAAALGDPDLPMLLTTALRGGGGFDVHYQPVVRLDDGTAARVPGMTGPGMTGSGTTGPGMTEPGMTEPVTVAVEALARWTHPVLGAVPPDVFVAAAERAGLISELDNLVLDRACQEAVTLAERGSPVAMHVNVCASRLCEPELEATVRATLDRYALPATRLVLEITETSLVPDLDAAARTIDRLRGLGIRFAIDDFGTGYNTLAQLHLLPVDIVKLCQAHTAVDGAERVEALCRSVVSICQSLGLTVIAEGVESVSQAEALARLGCQLGQGYLYGRPAPLVRQGQETLEPEAAPAEVLSSVSASID